MLAAVADLARRLRDHFRWDRLEREMEAEIRFHLQMRAEENADRGLDPDDAMRAARYAFGNRTRIEEACREAQGRLLVESLVQDIRFGARTFVKNPLFSFVAVATLALGIGANTAIFSVVDATLLRPLPYADANRLVVLWETFASDTSAHMVSPANFQAWREQSSTFEKVAAFRDTTMALTGAGDPVEVAVERATDNFFATLGVEAALGRAFLPEDSSQSAPRVAVISHALWQRRFGGDPAVVGRTIDLDGQPTVLVGILPESFRWSVALRPGAWAGVSAPPEVWVPFDRRISVLSPRGRSLSVVARLAPAASLETGREEMAAIAAGLAEQYPEFNARAGVRVTPLREHFVGDVRPAMLVLLAAVALVLLLACANVASLMLARAAARRREIAVRTSLGASRGRVVRQLLTESIMLALAGGALGLVVARVALDLLVAVGPVRLFSTADVGLDASVLAFTLVVSFVTALLFGAAPALEASNVDPQEALRAAGRGIAGTPKGRRVRAVLVAAEIAIALVLLVGAGLLDRSFVALRAIDPGFDAANVLTFKIKLPVERYSTDEELVAFFRQTAARIAALPGVRAVGEVQYLPFAGPGASTSMSIEGRPPDPHGFEPSTDVLVVDDGYFRAMNIPIVAGRGFAPEEVAAPRHVAVVNETLARRYFAGEDPIGRRLTVDMADEPEPVVVVGVVEDVKFQTLTDEAPPTVYLGHAELPYEFMTLVVRGDGDPSALVPAIRREVLSLDADRPIADVRTLDELLATASAESRFNALLLSVFGVVALLLAGVGIYGLMAYSVTQRAHEIGLRMALGARARDVVALVLKQGMSITLAGLTTGLAISYALTRLGESLLYSVSPTDPTTYATIVGLLGGVALLANVVPSWRATKIEPRGALGGE
jgi:putative ABC transport system permease protein